MILRRLGESIRSQDWGTVALEVMVVVLGVFIGIQVSNWNDERQARLEEVNVLERLIAEAEEARIALTDHRDFHARNAEQTVALVDRMQDPQLCSDFDEDHEKVLLLSVGDFPAPRFSLTNAAELSVSGRLSLLRSRQVQAAIREIVVEMDHVSEQWRRYVRVKQDAEAVYLAAGVLQTRTIVDDIGPKDFYGAILDGFEFTTPERLCGNAELTALATNAAMSQSFYAAYLDQFGLVLGDYSQRLTSYADGRSGEVRLDEADR